MQKKEETRDYRKFDYLNVTVEKGGFEELTAYYAALGWECAEVKDDKIYYNLKRIVLRRPHNIAHKDELQLMQVYLESACNQIGKAATSPCPKTLTVGLLFGVVALSAMVFGLLCGLQVFKFMPNVWGYIIFGAGVVVAALNAGFAIKYYKKELKATRAAAETAVLEIKRVCFEAELLTGKTAKTEACDE